MRRRVTITHPDGLHARPAADLARLAQSTPGLQVIASDGTVVDAASVLAVMQLTLESDAVIHLQADGSDAAAVLDAAEAILAP